MPFLKRRKSTSTTWKRRSASKLHFNSPRFTGTWAFLQVELMANFLSVKSIFSQTHAQMKAHKKIAVQILALAFLNTLLKMVLRLGGYTSMGYLLNSAFLVGTLGVLIANRDKKVPFVEAFLAPFKNHLPAVLILMVIDTVLTGSFISFMQSAVVSKSMIIVSLAGIIQTLLSIVISWLFIPIVLALMVFSIPILLVAIGGPLLQMTVLDTMGTRDGLWILNLISRATLVASILVSTLTLMYFSYIKFCISEELRRQQII